MSELLPCKLCGVVPTHRADGLIAHGTWSSECPLWESSWMTTEQWTRLMGQGACRQAMLRPVTRSAIREVFLSHGFRIHDGMSDLKEYVYQAAEALLTVSDSRAAPPQAQGDDTARLSWLIRKLSGKALRDAGVIYSAGSETIRAAIDAAMK
jgi:hypothetical protein